LVVDRARVLGLGAAAGAGLRRLLGGGDELGEKGGRRRPACHWRLAQRGSGGRNERPARGPNARPSHGLRSLGMRPSRIGDFGSALGRHRRLLSRIWTYPGVARGRSQAACQLGGFPNHSWSSRRFRGDSPTGIGAAVATQDASAQTHGMLDPAQILASVGEAPYAWQLDSDALTWGANVGEVLTGVDPAALANERSYAQLTDPASGASPP